MAKRRTNAPVVAPDGNTVKRSSAVLTQHYADEKPEDALARTITRPEVHAGALIQTLEQDNYEVNAIIRQLENQVAAVQSGDLKRGEAMLTAQAHSLDGLFNNLARHAIRNFNGRRLQAGESYLRLALKAQAQCRVTWEAIAEIKNPRPVAFVRQANIANGPQQINYVPRAGETETQPNKLLEAQNGERMDTGATGAASRGDQALEAVGTINGATNGRR